MKQSHAVMMVLLVMVIVSGGCLQSAPGSATGTTSPAATDARCDSLAEGSTPCPVESVPPDLRLVNVNLTEDAVINVTITDQRSETVYEKNVSLGAERTSIILEDVVTTPGNYTIHAQRGDDRATMEWEVGERVTINGAIYQIDVYASRLEITRVSHG